MFDLDLRRSMVETAESVEFPKIPSRSTTSRMNSTNTRLNSTRLNSNKTARSDQFRGVDQASIDINFVGNSQRSFMKSYNNDQSESEFDGEDSYYNMTNLKLPRVVVRNSMGSIMKTETSFQRSIAESRLRLREEGLFPIFFLKRNLSMENFKDAR